MDKLVESLTEILRDDGYVCVSPETPATPDEATSRGPIHSTLPTDDADFCEIIAEFESRLREKLGDMRRAISTQDCEELAQLAHWLKGSGGTAGFHAFTDLAKELELLARQEAPDEQIDIIVSEIEAITECIVVPVFSADPS